VHAQVRREVDGAQDRYVLLGIGRLGDTLLNGEPVTRAVLRSASRVRVGGWQLSFVRDPAGLPEQREHQP
jgi:hypothetical protein